MNKKYLIILSILNKYIATTLTGRDVYKEMEESERGVFRGIDDVNKTLFYLFKHKEYVEHGESKPWAGGSTLNTYKISQKGKKYIEQFSEKTIVINTPIEEEKSLNTEDKKETDVLTAFDAALEMARDIARETIKKAIENKPVVENREAKIQVLRHVGQFVKPINEDFERALNDIICDLEKLEAA